MSQLSAAEELARTGPAARGGRPYSRDLAAAYCRRLARRHYENFTVASWFLPRRLRPHFYAIYAYCRWADDLADETASAGESLALLDSWQEQLERCYVGRAEHPVCGDVVDLQVRLQGDRVEDLAWRARGCPACMAVTATAWQALRGGSVDEASRRLRDRVAELGGLQPFERHAERLVLRAFGQAVGVELPPP